MSSKIKVYLEVGRQRTFAGAVDWPGWSRVAKDKDAALQSLLDHAPRYARAIRSARLGFEAPKELSAFVVVEKVKGNGVTDFGAPDVPPPSDKKPVGDKELKRLQDILKACWKAFDAAVKKAKGKKLRLGPRGGGRDVMKIVEHVHGGEMAYLTALGGKVSSEASLKERREAVLRTLEASVRGEIAARGPRGGKRWSPRYFVRRAAWHILDHIWEIEDRSK